MKTEEIDFNYKGSIYMLDVPIYLIHINNLTDILAENDENDMLSDNKEYDEAYWYLERQCSKIFARHLKLKHKNILCEFLVPIDENNKISRFSVRVVDLS